MGSPYNTQAYRQAKARFIATAAPVCTWEDCPIPDRRIDTRLSGNHPWGPSIDHRQPTSAGGSMWDASNWQLMHRRCNTAKGTRVENRRTDLTW